MSDKLRTAVSFIKCLLPLTCRSESFLRGVYSSLCYHVHRVIKRKLANNYSVFASLSEQVISDMCRTGDMPRGSQEAGSETDMGGLLGSDHFSMRIKRTPDTGFIMTTILKPLLPA